MSSRCVYDRECEFKTERGFCRFSESCNQQAKPYSINGEILWLRESDLVLLSYVGDEHLMNLCDREEKQK